MSKINLVSSRATRPSSLCGRISTPYHANICVVGIFNSNSRMATSCERHHSRERSWQSSQYAHGQPFSGIPRIYHSRASRIPIQLAIYILTLVKRRTTPQAKRGFRINRPVLVVCVHILHVLASARRPITMPHAINIKMPRQRTENTQPTRRASHCAPRQFQQCAHRIYHI